MTIAILRVSIPSERMDAHRKRTRKLIDGLTVAALAALVLVGLWQGYGAWLIATVKSHVG